jgi:hypothetical protein
VPQNYDKLDCRRIQKLQIEEVSRAFEVTEKKIHIAQNNPFMMKSLMWNLSKLSCQNQVYLLVENPCCKFQLDFGLFMPKNQPLRQDNVPMPVIIIEDRQEMIELFDQEHYYIGIEISGDSYKVDYNTNLLKKNNKKNILEEVGLQYEHIQLNWKNMQNIEERFSKLFSQLNELPVN